MKSSTSSGIVPENCIPVNAFPAGERAEIRVSCLVICSIAVSFVNLHCGWFFCDCITNHLLSSHVAERLMSSVGLLLFVVCLVCFVMLGRLPLKL